MLWVKNTKAGKKSRTPPPEWLDPILLAEESGIPLPQLLEMDLIWIKRLEEYLYHCRTQDFHPFR
jgi:hypothetical protein